MISTRATLNGASKTLGMKKMREFRSSDSEMEMKFEEFVSATPNH